MTKRFDGTTFCDHCRKLTQYHLSTVRIYGVEMLPSKICNECDYAIQARELVFADDAMSDNERAARLAGWLPGQDYGPPPDYEHSIDAQMADLDPLVEARWGRFDQFIHFSEGRWWVRIEPARPPWPEFEGEADTWIVARLKALLAALEAQS